MTTEAQVMGVRCNLGCTYCYQNPMRDAGNFGDAYDLDKVKRAIALEGGPFTLFGGEALLMPFADLEDLCRWGFEHYGGGSIQTNATLLTAAHVALFARYKVAVGISMDGPAALNDSRWAGSLEKTRIMTERSSAAIRMLVAAGQIPSLIVTLYRGNATGVALDGLADWFVELDALGLRHVRVHLLEVDHDLVAASQALTVAETLAALDRLATLQARLRVLRFDLFEEVRARLKGDTAAGSCVWHGCDPYTTPAVRAVDGQGNRSNCGRTNKDGVNWIKADQASDARTHALYHTPIAHGGCGGCRFFFACQGYCPGTAIGGDWRNRSEQCDVVFGILELQERALLAEGVTPVTLRPAERARLEAAILAPPGRGNRPHGDVPHGDKPHGDHTDQALADKLRAEAECARVNHHDGPCAACTYGRAQ